MTLNDILGRMNSTYIFKYLKYLKYIVIIKITDFCLIGLDGNGNRAASQVVAMDWLCSVSKIG